MPKTMEITRNRAQYCLAYDDQVVCGRSIRIFLVRNIRDYLGKAWGKAKSKRN